MTAKKIIAVVASAVIGLGLIVLLFVGGIVGMAFYQISNGEAGITAKDFLKKNERLKQDIGEIKDFGTFVTGNINISNGDGTATLNLKVIGERKTVNASVEMMYRSGHQWRVTAASFKNDAGETIDLLNPYEARTFVPNWVAFSRVSLRSLGVLCVAVVNDSQQPLTTETQRAQSSHREVLRQRKEVGGLI